MVYMFKSDLTPYYSNHHPISDTLPLHAQGMCFLIRLTDRVIVVQLGLLRVSQLQLYSKKHPVGYNFCYKLISRIVDFHLPKLHTKSTDRTEVVIMDLNR